MQVSIMLIKQIEYLLADMYIELLWGLLPVCWFG